MEPNVGVNLIINSNCTECCPRVTWFNCCCKPQIEPATECEHKVHVAAKGIRPPVEKKKAPLFRWFTR